MGTVFLCFSEYFCFSAAYTKTCFVSSICKMMAKQVLVNVSPKLKIAYGFEREKLIAPFAAPLQ